MLRVSLDVFDPDLAALQRFHSDRLPSAQVWLRSREWQEWSRGLRANTPSERTFSVAIVGTRKPSSYGVRVVEELVRRLSAYRVRVVSGGAFGIDRVAHEAALSWGLATHAWLVGPLEDPSPKSHRKVFEDIEKAPGSALVVPDFLERSEALRSRLGSRAWLARNAWVAAQASAVVVVEAFLKSGTWQSVKDSDALGRPCYAVPGPIFAASSHGTNRMISRNYANPVADLGELTESLVVLAEGASYNISKRPEKCRPPARGC